MTAVRVGSFSKLEVGILGLLAGVVVPLIVGFDGGFWVTKKAALRMVQEAVTPVRAALCVAQFTSAPNYQDKLKEYKALDTTAKGNYLGKGGWGKMPTEEKVSDEVAKACGDALDKL
jgi:hypothetical protein